jgi:hypothetical protein
MDAAPRIWRNDSVAGCGAWSSAAQIAFLTSRNSLQKKCVHHSDHFFDDQMSYSLKTTTFRRRFAK